ncbi:MAG: hypothetical protein AMXMBFR13_13610 [Phycisphaerae bacterium]
MHTVAVILVRAGSKGLPDKCVLPLCGRPVLSYTIGHAQQSRYVDEIILSTDSARAAAIGRAAGLFLVQRPPELASDTANAQDATRHAVTTYEEATGLRVDTVVVLGGNIPIRAEGIIDQCVDRLVSTGCDSVQTVAAVGKFHPDWMYRLDDGRMQQYRPNNIVRRQDLEQLYLLDGAVVVARRERLMDPAGQANPTAYLGDYGEAVVHEDCVDIDTLTDFYVAEAVLRVRSEAVIADFPTAGTRRRACTAAIGLRQRS